MYISEFWCGVFSTIFTEMFILIGYAAWNTSKNKDKKE